MSQRSEYAADLFANGLGCAPAVLGAFAADYGMKPEDAFAIACGFRGGIGARQDICGAVTGAVMVLGLEYGHREPGDSEAKKNTARKVNEFCSWFEKEYGSLDCRCLFGFDLNNPEEVRKAKKVGAFDRCRNFVRESAEKLEEMMGK